MSSAEFIVRLLSKPLLKDTCLVNLMDKINLPQTQPQIHYQFKKTVDCNASLVLCPQIIKNTISFNDLQKQKKTCPLHYYMTNDDVMTLHLPI